MFKWIMNRLREKAGNWIESKKIQSIIIVLIIINSITIGLETSDYAMQNFGGLLKTLDQIILAIFVIEIVIKLFAFGGGFFKKPWNVFDFVIVGIALFPSSGVFSILRVLRVLRTLRLLKAIPRLRFIVEALLRAVPSIGWIFVLLAMVFYVFAVMGTKLFGAAFPVWFGTVGKSMYSLFQIMTLESWSMGIARPVMEQFPYAYLFFIPFILIATYTTLNIFIAIVVNTMSEIHQKELEKETIEIEEFVHTEHVDIRSDISRIEAQISGLEKKLDKLLEQDKNLVEK